MEVSGKKAKTDGEVSGRRPGNLRATKPGSDEQLPLCQVGERTGETTDANTLCLECSNRMCNICSHAHRGSQLTSRHQLLDKSQMPWKAFKARHKCDTHPDTLIEYYCKKQDQLLCRHCITLNHQGCQGDDLITNVCGFVEDRNEIRKMYKDLKDIQQNITQQESKQKSNLAAIDTNRQKIKRDIDNFKKELHLFVDRLVEQMHEEVEGIVDTDKDGMAAVSKECDNVTAEIRDLEVDITKQSNQKIQLFIVMKTAQQAVAMLSYKMKSIDTQNRTREYNFVSNTQLRDMLRSVEKLGQLSIEGEEPVQSADVGLPVKASGQRLGKLSVKEPAQPAAAVHDVQACVANRTGEMAAKGKSDRYFKCHITGIELLDDGRFAIIDNDCSNKSVKILSLSQKRIKHQLQLPYAPWDITKISKNTLAVTCPRGGYIQMIQLGSVSWWFGSLSLGRQIQVHGQCRGIQYSDAGGGRMVVIDMSGTVLKDLSSDSAGTPLFTSPGHVAVSQDRQCVYVSDWYNHTVTRITLDGRVLFIYRDYQLKHPKGLAVGDDGVIYVCGYWSDNILMVSCEGRKIKVLLGEKDGVKDPCGIMYNSANHKLYVGNNSVLVFTMTDTR